MITIFDIPEEILFGIIKNYTNVNNLLKCTKKFEIHKYKYFFYNLKREYSIKFYFDDLFRNYLLSNIKSSKNQLSLNISKSLIPNLNNLTDVYSINISFCPNIKDIKPLENVHTLVVSEYPNFIGYELKKFGNIKEFYFIELCITDFMV